MVFDLEVDEDISQCICGPREGWFIACEFSEKVPSKLESFRL